MTVLRAVADRRFLFGAWPWRAAAFLASTVPVGVAVAFPFGLLGLPWLVLVARGSPSVSDVPLLVGGSVALAAFGPLVALPLADVERARLRLVDERVLRSEHRAAADAWTWLRTRYTEAATWRELGYALLLVTAGPVVYGLVLMVPVLLISWLLAPFAVGDGPVALGLGTVDTQAQALPFAVAAVLLLPAVPYLLAVVAGAHAAVATALLGTRDLRAELIEVTRSRARLADAFEAERQRIERDLHDGAQQRLISLSLQLGVARLLLDEEAPAGAAVADAHRQAKELMTELRELIHGIRPQLLTDLGLPDALRELADRSPVPADVRASLPGRPAPHLETTAYFVVAEALTNVAKHSGAERVAVTVAREADVLTVEILDDGRGGADPGGGTGLTGLADRVAAVDGRMLLASPAGGPTRLRVELPWVAA